MTSRFRVVAASAALGFLSILALPPASASAATGPEVFSAQGCTECHSVKSLGIKLDKDGTLEADLSTVGRDHDKKWIARFLLKKVEKDGEKHKKKFRGAKEDLKVIAIWLAAQK